MSLDECRDRLPISALWGKLGLSGAEKVAGLTPGGREAKIRSPFREDKKPSFSVWMGSDGHGYWKDHGNGDSGDEVTAIERVQGCSTKDAIGMYCSLAGVVSRGSGGGRPVRPVRAAKPKTEIKRKKPAGLADRMDGVEVVKKASADQGGKRRQVAVYDYHDAAGELAHQTIRFEPKEFRQRRPAREGEDGEWVWSLKDAPVYPYRLPEILAADPAEPIFLVEGEKDVEKLEMLGGVVATTLPMGAGKWRPEFAQWFRDRWVVVLPDYDRPGLEGAEAVAMELFEVVDRIGVCPVDELWKGARPGADVADWLEAGWEIGVTVEEQRAELMRAAERAGSACLDLFGEVVYQGSRELRVREDMLARRLVRRQGLMFCGDSFWQWRPRKGLWERKREKTWVERQVRETLREAGGEDMITKNRVMSVVGLARSERHRFPEDLNAYPDGCLPVRNGLLDVETGKLYPYRHRHLTTIQVPHAYDPAATCPEWLAWLEDRQDDEETRRQLQEIFGYCLFPHINYHAFFFLFGEGGTGKSTAVDVLEMLVGSENKVSLELTELDNAFTRSQLVGKTLYLAKELTSKSFRHIGLIKAIVSGDPISVDVKYGTGFDFRPRGRLVMESNVIAATPDSSGGFERRFIQVNFDKQIDRRKMEYGFQARFALEMPGILNWAIEGYLRLVERGRFEHTERSQEATDNLLKHRAQVPSFLKEEWLVDRGADSGVEIRMDAIVGLYQDWCEENDVVAFFQDKQMFAREFFARRPEWRGRKKRKWFEGTRDFVLRGIENVRQRDPDDWDGVNGEFDDD